MEKVPPLSAQVNAKIVNVESLFPEFQNIQVEDWITPLEGETIMYPKHINVTSSKAIRQLLNLDAEPQGDEDGKKGKKDKKADKKPAKGAAVSMEFVEVDEDENGIKQPKMFWGTEPASETEFCGFKIPAPFVRHWSAEQNERRTEQNRLKQLAADELYRNENTDPAAPVPEEEEELDKNHHQEAYAAALYERDVETEASMGIEVDPVMCSIFRYIERYAPNVTSEARSVTDTDVDDSKHDGMEFLWRSIYPQMPNGRPMFNPNGKYIVRLYLGGKWRKVAVNDSIPLDGNGLPVICCSSASLELWPMILSKAVYAAYTACQYNNLTDSLGLFPVDIAEVAASDKSMSAASFASFAVHVLTGWLPSNPFSIVENISNNGNMEQLLTSIITGGAASITRNSIPGENPAENIDDDPDRPRNIPKTLKTLRSEFEKRIEVRNTLISDIQIRETKIDMLEQASKSSYKESYCVCFQDDDPNNGMRVLPILAVSFPDDQTLSREDRIANTLFLTHWHRGEMIFAEPKGDEACKGIGGAMEEALTRPIPGSCNVTQDWMSLKFFLEKGATMFCLDTLVCTPNKALLGWHWMPALEEVAAVDPKAKGKKPVKDPKLEQTNTSIVVNPGELPTMFLKMDTSGVTVDTPDITLTVFVHNDVLQQVTEEAESVFPRGNTMLLLEEIIQNGEDASAPLRVSVELMTNELLPFTKISVQLPSAQLSKCPSTVFSIRIIGNGSSLVQFGAGVPIEVGEGYKIWESVAGKHVLVRDGEVTKPVRCEGESLVFRQLLQLSAGVSGGSTVMAFLHVSDKEIFKCINQVIALDDLVDNNYTLLPRPNGNYIKVTPETAVLLVGRIYHYATHLPGFTWKLTVISDLPLQPHNVLTETTADKHIGGYRPNNKAMLFRDVISAEKESFPLSIRFALKPVDYLQTVLANSGSASSASASRPASATAAVVGAAAALGPRPGSPNFFGDVPTTGAESILEPYYSYIDSESESKDIDNYDNKNGLLSNVSFIVKTYRKYDRKLVGEYKSENGFLSLYNIAVEGYVDKKAPSPVAAVPGTVTPNIVDIIVECVLDPTIKIPQRWQNKWPYQFIAKEAISAEHHHHAAGESSPGNSVAGRPTSGRPMSGNSVSSMTVSKHFNASSAPQNPLFLWQLDVLGGNVTNTMHDMHDLEAALAIKTKWEEEKAGRAARAMAAMEAYGQKKELQVQNELNLLDEEMDINIEKSLSASKSAAASPRSNVGGNAPIVTMDKVIASLATALEKPIDVITARENLIAQCSTYHEFIEEELLDNEEYAPAQLITPESIEKSRAFQESKAKAHEEESARLNEVIANFSETVRTKTKERIGVLASNGVNNLKTAKEMWAKREQYKVDISNRNAALRYLLSRASDAIAATTENPDDKKKKGGTKKK